MLLNRMPVSGLGAVRSTISPDEAYEPRPPRMRAHDGARRSFESGDTFFGRPPGRIRGSQAPLLEPGVCKCTCRALFRKRRVIDVLL